MACDRALPHGFRKMGQYMKLHGWTTISIGGVLKPTGCSGNGHDQSGLLI